MHIHLAAFVALVVCGARRGRIDLDASGGSLRSIATVKCFARDNPVDFCAMSACRLHHPRT
jgi:hypothetical protein